jgi:prepilin-type N-terminal cleavage/methylation domain-containing protein
MTPMQRDDRGFTLVELIVVTVLGALLIAASLQILITNQRTYTAQTAQIKSQQSTRAAMDILFNELREVSARGGDVISMNGTRLTVRTMRKFGVVCAVSTASPPVLTVLKAGNWFEGGDSVFVFADNKTSLSSDDAWITARVTGVDTTAACGAQKAVDLSFGGQGSLFTADSVRTGAPLRSFTRNTYGLVTMDGDTYLGRIGADKSEVPMVGPLDASGGLAFVYQDSLGATTSNTGDVRRILVTIRTTSRVLNATGELVADSITGVIYTRN